MRLVDESNKRGVFLDTDIFSLAKGMEVSRRNFLKKSVAVASAAIVTQSELFANAGSERILNLRAVHQHKDYSAEFYEKDSYKISGLFEINKAFMDTRAMEVTRIDIDLINLLYEINLHVGMEKKFHVISGYRSKRTNDWLRHQLGGRNVAKNSFHIQGKAVDINVPGVPLHKLRDIAMGLKRGGVGYYPSKGFIHVDVGPVRSWRRG